MGFSSACWREGTSCWRACRGWAKPPCCARSARVLHLKYSRIQFTPDLMPGDIVGSMIIDTESGAKALRFQPGPIFAHLVLADEINRATPKTQSALLEAMQEHTVTSGTTTHELEAPFLVMATQNPIEMEGTYPLPEAQLDRFLMKILVRYPSREDLSTIVTRTTQKEEAQLRTILNREEIMELRARVPPCSGGAACAELCHRSGDGYATDTSESHELSKKFIRFGSSPRGAQALVECGQVLALMRGRLHLAIEDVQTVAAAVLRHRIILNFDAHAEGQTPETILNKIIPSVVAAGGRQGLSGAGNGPLIDTPLLEKLERLAIQWQKSLPGVVGGHNTSRFAGRGPGVSGSPAIS